MSQPSYRALRVVLGFLSLLMAIGGVLLIFSSKPLIMRVFMHPPGVGSLHFASRGPVLWIGFFRHSV